jgi:S-formylglutathione hydrolase FrmB
MNRLKIFSLITLLLIILLNCNSNKKIGKILNINIPAPSLSNNRIDEPLNQPAVIYLPPSYNKFGKRFPVVYFLPGFNTPITAYTSGFFQGFTLRSIDDLIKNKKINEMIFVIINGRNKLGGSFYVNSPVTGNWENFIAKDVVAYIDKNYKTIKNVNSRGIAGHSMGGFGALNIAMKHPDVFCAVYSLSPGLFDENGLKDAMVSWQSLRIILNAYGAAFSPDLNIESPYAEIPKSDKDASWSRWEDGFGNLKNKVYDYKNNLLLLKRIVIDVGTNDEYQWILRGSRYFSKELTSAGIPNDLVEYEGNHINKIGKRIENYLLPFFSSILKFK